MTSTVEPSRTPVVVDRPLDQNTWRTVWGTRLNTMAAKLREPTGVVKWFNAAVALVFESASLGLMRRLDVDAMVSQTYASRPDFYDPRRYRLPHEESMLAELEHHRTGCRLLDAFCGQGREAELLARAGYDVTGIDRLDWMIDAAKRYASESGFDADFQTADFSVYQTDESFEVVYTSSWMLSTFQGSDRRQEFLQQCMRLCDPNGIAVVSYIDDATDSKTSRWIRYFVARLIALATLGNRDVERGERIYSGLFWHHLSRDVVLQDIESSGWRLLSSVDGKGLAPTFLFLSRQDVGKKR